MLPVFPLMKPLWKPSCLAFDEVAQGLLSDVDLMPELTIDAELLPEQIGFEMAEMVERFMPFGMGNPEPVFMLRKATVIEQRCLKERHLKLRLRAGRRTFDAIGFNMAEGKTAARNHRCSLFSGSKYLERQTTHSVAPEGLPGGRGYTDHYRNQCHTRICGVTHMNMLIKPGRHVTAVVAILLINAFLLASACCAGTLYDRSLVILEKRLAKAAPDDFTFVVLGDSKDSDEIFRKALKLAATYNPLFILHDGDFSPTGSSTEVDHFLELVRQNIPDIPLFVVPGTMSRNHRSWRK